MIFLIILFILAICHLAADPGPCYEYKERWFFDVRSGKCRIFVFRGCGGNKNRFSTEYECEKSCSEYLRIKTFSFSNSGIENNSSGNPGKRTFLESEIPQFLSIEFGIRWYFLQESETVAVYLIYRVFSGISGLTEWWKIWTGIQDFQDWQPPYLPLATHR